MNKINNIIIFVGGKGKRLGKLTKKTPKPLIKINQKPFIDYQIEKLIKIGPKKIILLCGYKNKKFLEKYKNKKIGKTEIVCHVEKTPLGTGGALENAKKFIVNNTLVCNGDTYFDYRFEDLKKLKTKSNCANLILVKNINYKSNNKLSSLEIKNNKIIYKKQSKFMNSGYYIINKQIIKYLKKGFNSFEEDILKNLILENKINGIKLNKNLHIDIGTKKNLKAFEKYIKKI